MFLNDGFSTTVTFALAPGIFLREREVQPPALDLGGMIETSTMRNVRMRTHAAKSLLTLGALVMQCQYDPFVYAQLLPLMGVAQGILVLFPDTATLTLRGFIDKFTPPSHKEGDFPVAEVRIEFTNRDGGGLETLPAVGAGVLLGAVR